MNLTVLFQLLFSIIYSIFSKKISISTKVVFAISLKGQFFLLFSLFLLIFMSLIALFNIIYGLYRTFSTTF